MHDTHSPQTNSWHREKETLNIGGGGGEVGGDSGVILVQVCEPVHAYFETNLAFETQPIHILDFTES